MKIKLIYEPIKLAQQSHPYDSLGNPNTTSSKLASDLFFNEPQMLQDAEIYGVLSVSQTQTKDVYVINVKIY